MEVFAYNPRTQRESLKDFNDRVQGFCLENPVIRITSAVFGSNLLLTMLLSSDVDQAGMETVMPVVRSIKASDPTLEENINAILAHELETSTDDEPRVPVETQFIARQDKPEEGWVVVSVVNGVSEDNDDESEDDGGDMIRDGEVVK